MLHIHRIFRRKRGIQNPEFNKLIRPRRGDWKIAAQANLLIWIPLWMVVIGFLTHSAARLLGHRGALPKDAAAFGVIGVIAFLSTGFGAGTVRAIRRARAAMAYFGGSLPKTWQIHESLWYCDKAGIKAVALETGMLDDLIPRYRNTWTGPIAFPRPTDPESGGHKTPLL